MPVYYDPSADPADFSDSEQQMIDAINSAGERHEPSMATVALGMGAAFLVYRKFMVRKLREETSLRYPTTPDALGELATRIFGVYVNKIIPLLAVNLAIGYTQGVKLAGGNASKEWVESASRTYAANLSTSLNEVSVKAMVEGVQAQINRGVPMRIALDRTIDAFGVTPKTMKALVNLWTKTPMKSTTARPVKNSLKDLVDSRIAKAITDRAKTIGETESYLSYNASQAMFWAWQAEQGQIPGMAEKEWVTAADERTCPICAPLNGVRVLVSEKFDSSIGKIMAPGIHVNCRCTLVLHLNLDLSDIANEYDESAWGVVHKAQGSDQYDRDKDGQFASTESRGTRPQDRFQQYADDVQPLKLTQLNAKGLKLNTLDAKGLRAKPIEIKQLATSKPLSTMESLKMNKELKAKKDLFVSQQLTAMKQAAQPAVSAAEKSGDQAMYLHYLTADGEALMAVSASAYDDEGYERHIYEHMSDNYEEIAHAATYAFERLELHASIDDNNSATHADGEYARISLNDGRNAFISQEQLFEFAQLAYDGSNQGVHVEIKPSGRGNVHQSRDAVVPVKELFENMGTAGEELLNEVVQYRYATFIATAGSADPEFGSVDKYMQAAVKSTVQDWQSDPWSESWRDPIEYSPDDDELKRQFNIDTGWGTI